MVIGTAIPIDVRAKNASIFSPKVPVNMAKHLFLTKYYDSQPSQHILLIKMPLNF